ncbi:MAG: anti-sigma-28 factor, FlgM [Phycisphaerales bacterium]|nr:anti-sigma-28 factor, FlgM [Phycisphaerales bacterium]
MSSVNNVGTNSPVYTVTRPGVRPMNQTAAPASTGPVRGKDTVELSGKADIGQMMKTLKAGGDVRLDKVADIKARIAAGTYEDDAKLDAATDRLLDEVLKA